MFALVIVYNERVSRMEMEKVMKKYTDKMSLFLYLITLVFKE